MCRLALMNAPAVSLLGKSLDSFLRYLERERGGDGNGIALLAPDGRVRIRKGVRFSAAQAAGEIRFANHQGMSWAVFHTRLATTARIHASCCHPFRAGQLVLAHNGHDELFARLGALVGRSDSDYLARTWNRDRHPLVALQRRTGVFLGFMEGHPFVIKGQPARDLVLASHRETGAILFASQLPEDLKSRFDLCFEVGRLVWNSEPLAFDTIERRPAPTEKKKPALQENVPDRSADTCACLSPASLG